MKRTLYLFIPVMLIVLFLRIFAVQDAVSGQSGSALNGSIKVCWGLTCASDVETTVVNLVDASGNTIATCTITPPATCCKMSGNFPSGTYHFEYNRPTGTTDCRTADFHYLNGTDVEKDVICRCP